MLRETFEALLKNYSDSPRLSEELWTEVTAHYSHKKRHYHTLQHLGNLFHQLSGVKETIQNWDTILFTLFYHDIIYNPIKSDNEEKSAELAEKRLKQISYPEDQITLCREQILATKSHVISGNNDSNFFTDADLSILGHSWEDYTLYYKQIRKEYSVYPDFVYNPGRKKVLSHFLAMDRIFKTDQFHKKFENQARVNLQKEFDLL